MTWSTGSLYALGMRGAVAAANRHTAEAGASAPGGEGSAVDTVAAGLPVDEAIDQPRLQIEAGWSDGTVEQLQQTGHRMNPWPGWNPSFGGVCAVERLPDGHLAATGDRRRRGHGVDVP